MKAIIDLSKKKVNLDGTTFDKASGIFIGYKDGYYGTNVLQKLGFSTNVELAKAYMRKGANYLIIQVEMDEKDIKFGDIDKLLSSSLKPSKPFNRFRLLEVDKIVKIKKSKKTSKKAKKSAKTYKKGSKK